MYEENDNTSVPASDMEPDIGNAPLGARKATKINTRCSIHLHSKRKRLTDADGISAKAAIDGLVRAGLLKDDSAKYVEKVTYSQEKTKGKEYVVITIEWD